MQSRCITSYAYKLFLCVGGDGAIMPIKITCKHNYWVWEVASYSRTVIHRNSSHMHTKAAIHQCVQVIKLTLASKEKFAKNFLSCTCTCVKVSISPVVTLYILHMSTLSVGRREDRAGRHMWPQHGEGHLTNWHFLLLLGQPLGPCPHTGRRPDSFLYYAEPSNIHSTLSPTVGDSWS